MDAWRAATAQAEQLIAAVKDECVLAELLRTDTGDGLEAAVSAHARANALWEAVQHRRESWARQFEGDAVAAVSATDTDPAPPTQDGARLGRLSVDGAPFNHDGAGARLYPGVTAER